MAEPLTNSDLQEVLDELYDIDPSLRDKESHLKNVIQKLAVSRPKAPLEPAFVERVKGQLMNHVIENSMNEKSLSKPSIADRFSLTSLVFAAGGIVVGLLVAFVTLEGPVRVDTSFTDPVGKNMESSGTAGIQIARVDRNAFGSIALQSQDTLGEDASEAVGAGGSATFVPNARSLSAEGPAALPSPGAEKEVARALPPEYAKRYEFVYAGEDFSIDQARMDVYKQVSGSVRIGNFDSLIRSMDAGLVDLSAFSTLSVQSASFKQDEEFGYVIHVNPSVGSASISQNWEQWKAIQPECEDEACWEAYRLEPSDVPEDQRLITVADAFVMAHGIDLSSYGDPVVDRSWDVYIERGEREAVPDVVQVLYPLELEGKRVYHARGSNAGISVGVNVRAMKVSHVNGIRALAYQASGYDIETDIRAILEDAKHGGLYNRQYEGADETVQVEIGTPTSVLIQVSQYVNGEHAELAVPALIFPVLSDLQAYGFWQENIVVPLVKDVISGTGGPVPRPFPEPVPLLETEAAPAPVDEEGC